MDASASHFPLDPHGTSDLLQNVPFLIETQRQTTYRHVLRLQEIRARSTDAHREADRKVAMIKARDDVRRLSLLLRELRGSTADKRAMWRLAALGLTIPALVLNRETSSLLTNNHTRGPAAVAGLALLGQFARKEAAPLVAARLERQLAEVSNIVEDDGERLLAFLESWEWKSLAYL